MKENKTKYVILGLLNHEKCSGYNIKKRIDIALSKFWSAGFGQIYPTLKQLEAEGLIRHCDSCYDFGPERKIYQITGTGRVALKKWLEIPVIKEEVRYEILLKLFFGAAVDEQVVLGQIADFRQRNERLLCEVGAMEQQLKSIVHLSRDHQYFYLTALFGCKVYQAYLEWAEETENILKQVDFTRSECGEEKGDKEND